MNIEERLRDAFKAAAGTVRPETVRACPDPPRRRRHLKISHNGSRGLALVPVVTAAAVALIIGGASLAASQLLTEITTAGRTRGTDNRPWARSTGDCHGISSPRMAIPAR